MGRKILMLQFPEDATIRNLREEIMREEMEAEEYNR
jgi:hypothetical protein